MQYLTEYEFEQFYKLLLNELSEYKVIICSTIYLDSETYGNISLKNYEKANTFLSNISDNYVDLFGELKKVVEIEGWESVFYADHFHPNERGYEYIGSRIADNIISDILKDKT